MDDEMVLHFLSEASDWGEQFSQIALKYEDELLPRDILDEVFRGVHSLKGGASFLVVDDGRLETLTTFCHSYETLLSNIIQSGSNSIKNKLVVDGLFIISSDITKLAAGGEIQEHEKFSEECKNALDEKTTATFYDKETEAGHLSRDGNEVNITIEKNIKTTYECDNFSKMILSETQMVGPECNLNIDLRGQSRLSSIAIGSIISLVMRVKRLSIVNPPRIMELFFARFHFKDIGIEVTTDVEMKLRHEQ